MANTMTKLDADQVIKEVYNEMDESLQVTLVGSSISTPIPVTLSGASNLDTKASFVIDSSDLTTTAFTVDAAAVQEYSKIAFYETTGETIELLVDDVIKFNIGPGCDQVVECIIPSGSKLSVRALNNATDGSLILNLLGV